MPNKVIYSLRRRRYKIYEQDIIILFNQNEEKCGFLLRFRRADAIIQPEGPLIAFVQLIK